MDLNEEKNIRTYKRISVYLKRFYSFTNRVISDMDGVEVHSVGNSMAVILHRLNLSYTRPTYVLKKADPEKQEIFKSDFKALKKHLR